MGIQQLTTIIAQQCKEQNRPMLHQYQTNVPDYRFGIPENYVAVSFEKNNTSTVLEFRVGLTNLLINSFNQHTGTHAVNHAANNDMLVVTIRNDSFSEEIIKLIEKCSSKAIRKFYQN